jgi:hypothetical protein
MHVYGCMRAPVVSRHVKGSGSGAVYGMVRSGLNTASFNGKQVQEAAVRNSAYGQHITGASPIKRRDMDSPLARRTRQPAGRQLFCCLRNTA